ncbi:MAG: alpha/beta hydrolase [Euryarchaeota archaeon]|nr:alpha/beta hydrolase [Euryarchaeota archaeon]
MAWRTVERDDATITWETVGAGPQVVFLHGATGTGGRHWGSVVKSFKRGFESHLVDLRGHGRSQDRASRLTLEMLVDDTIAVVEEIGGPVNLVGFSLGGAITLRLAIKRPDLVSSIVPCGTGYRFDQDDIKRSDAAFDVEKIAAQDSEWVGAMRAQHASLGGPDYWRPLVAKLRDLWREELKTGGIPPEGIRGITVPALVAVGDRDEFTGIDQPVEIYKMLPKGELFVAPDAEHFWHPMRPRLMAEVLEAFLGRNAPSTR